MSDKEQQIVDLAKSGQTRSQIKQATGACYRTIRTVLARTRTFVARPTGRSSTVRGERNLEQYGHVAKKLYETEDLSVHEVGERLGFSGRTVLRWLRLTGAAIRTSGRSGTKNGRYVDGHSVVLYEKLVQRQVCAVCGAEDKLVIHHKDGVHTNNVVENLEVLCVSCHARHHRNLSTIQKRKKRLCKNGHSLVEPNLYVDRYGHWVCRECCRQNSRRYLAKKRLAVKGQP